MVEAAQIVEAEAHPDVIDLNFGCPVKKVAGKGAGAGMLQNIPLLLDITREVVKAEDIIDYTRRDNVAERLVKRFGAAIGVGAVKSLAVAGPQLR